MAIGSGLSAQVGMKKETTYATRVVSDLFFEFESEGGVRQQKALQSQQLRSQRFFPSGPRYINTTRDAQVTLAAEVPNQGFGTIMDLAHGNTVTPVQQGATTAYLQTHNLTNDPTKSATIQVGKPSVDGVIRPFEYAGSMLTGINFACAVDDFLKFTATFDSNDEDTAQTLATASYATNLAGFNFQQCVVTVNGVVQNDTTGALAKSISLELSLPRAVERYGLRSAATKLKPILNAYSSASGSLGMEFKNLTQYALFTAGTKCPIIFAFTGSDLAGTAIPYAITFTIAQAVFTGTTPAVTGPDILDMECPFTILDNGTDPPIKIEIMDIRTAAL